MKMYVHKFLIVWTALLQENIVRGWSECSKSCGGGKQSRRICMWTGICSRVIRDCNTQPCEADSGLCETKPCKNGGVCKPVGTTYHCICQYGFRGRNCDEISHPCDEKPCKHGGFFERSGTSYKCHCGSQFSGVNCTETCSGKWTQWFDRDNPSDEGDYEDLISIRKEHRLKACISPSLLDGRVVGSLTHYKRSGDAVAASASTGLICLNKNQGQGKFCQDYEVRFCCPKIHDTKAIRFVSKTFLATITFVSTTGAVVGGGDSIHGYDDADGVGSGYASGASDYSGVGSVYSYFDDDVDDGDGNFSDSSYSGGSAESGDNEGNADKDNSSYSGGSADSGDNEGNADKDDSSYSGGSAVSGDNDGNTDTDDSSYSGGSGGSGDNDGNTDTDDSSYSGGSGDSGDNEGNDDKDDTECSRRFHDSAKRPRLIGRNCASSSKRVKRGLDLDITPKPLKRDLMLLIDESLSVGPTYFKKFLRLAKAIVRNMCGVIDVGESRTRISVVTFDLENHLHLNFNDYFNKEELVEKIGNIEYNRTTDGFTCLVDGLEYAKDEVFTEKHGSRSADPNAEQVIFLLSDGCTNCKQNSKGSASDHLRQIGQRLTDDGITIVTFLVGYHTDRCIKEMEALIDGTHCYQMFLYETWEEVDVIIDQLETTDCTRGWKGGAARHCDED